MSGRPLDVLEATLDGPITVHLKDGNGYFGTLAGYDQHMNLVLESTDEDPPDKPAVEPVEDTTVIRGDNVVTIET